MTDQDRARRAKELAHGALYPYRLRPNSPRWNEFDRLMDEIIAGPPSPPLPPDPTDPPDVKRAPRAYNLAPNNSDPRFCIAAPGVAKVGPDRYLDEGGSEYNGDGMNTGGVWRNRNRIVAGLKTSDMMDDKAVCDPYEWQGRMIGGAAGYPADSYEL